jgi:acyl-CoA synthetase (AMP-forming)/AMP-acid ligase II
MVPKRIEVVDHLPTTANGKVDYKRLVAERSEKDAAPVAATAVATPKVAEPA